MAEDIEDFIARAITDPESVVEGWPQEARINHQTRAVMSLLYVMIGPDREGHYAGTPATQALMDNAALRGSVARLMGTVLELRASRDEWKRKAADAAATLGRNRVATNAAGDEVVKLRRLLAGAALFGGLPDNLLAEIAEAIPGYDKMEAPRG